MDVEGGDGDGRRGREQEGRRGKGEKELQCREQLQGVSVMEEDGSGQGARQRLRASKYVGALLALHNSCARAHVCLRARTHICAYLRECVRHQCCLHATGEPGMPLYCERGAPRPGEAAAHPGSSPTHIGFRLPLQVDVGDASYPVHSGGGGGGGWGSMNAKHLLQVGPQPTLLELDVLY